MVEVSVLLDKPVKAEDLKIDLSKLEKIRINEPDEDDDEEQDPDDYIYYDKNKNISYGLSDGEIVNIKFTPAEKDLTALCSNETVREFAAHKEWLMAKLKRRPYVETERGFANVTEMTLSKNEFTPDCPSEDENATEASFDYARIEVETKTGSGDPTDVLTYNYVVSAGKIVGTGASVVWDLSGVAPGRYTITAGVDNGCGVCGTTKTETVTVKDYPECPKNKD